MRRRRCHRRRREFASGGPGADFRVLSRNVQSCQCHGESHRREASGQLARHELLVDGAERHAALVELARQCDDFTVHVEHLTVGDYWIDRGIVVERKSYADFALSLADGRLFPQAAKLARCPHRPVVLLEGPRPLQMPRIHPHALKGAMASLAVMWRLPVLLARDPGDSLIFCASSQASFAAHTAV